MVCVCLFFFQSRELPTHPCPPSVVGYSNILYNGLHVTQHLIVHSFIWAGYCVQLHLSGKGGVPFTNKLLDSIIKVNISALFRVLGSHIFILSCSAVCVTRSAGVRVPQPLHYVCSGTGCISSVAQKARHQNWAKGHEMCSISPSPSMQYCCTGFILCI